MAKITNKAKEYVKEWAYDSFDCGHIMDIDDYEEFAGICLEDGIKPSRELFHLYYEYVNNAREEYYYGNEDEMELSY